MTVMHVTEYNRVQERKYSEACSKWRPETGGFPQAAFYFFSNQFTGALRKTGYVAYDERTAILRPTRREAIQAYRGNR